MNDLNTIARLNAQSTINSAIQAARAAGKWVIAKYEGLHLVGHVETGRREDAVTIADELKAAAGASERFELLAPTA